MASIKPGVNAVVCTANTPLSFATVANTRVIYEIARGVITGSFDPASELNSLEQLTTGSCYWIEAKTAYELANTAPPLVPFSVPNLLFNGDFSLWDGTSARNWGVRFSGLVTLSKRDRDGGNFAQQVEVTNSGSWGAYLFQEPPFVLGKTYQVSFDYWTSGDNWINFDVTNDIGTERVVTIPLEATNGMWRSYNPFTFVYDKALAKQLRFYARNVGSFAVDNVVLTEVVAAPLPAPTPVPAPTPTPAPTPAPTPVPAPIGLFPPTTPALAARFLNQATFGARQSEVTALVGGSYNAWIDAQFTLPVTSCLKYVDDYGSGAYMNQVMEFWWESAVSRADQLRTRIAFALSEIIVVSAVGPLEIAYRTVASYWDVLQNNAFTNFRTLLEAIVYNPGMGKYLSYVWNYEDIGRNISADENFAREIMQLFTIGLVQLNQDGTVKLDSTGKPIPTYDNRVIGGMAKVFTGLESPDAGDGNRAAAPMTVNESRHSRTEKRIINGLTLAANRPFRDNLRDALDALFNHPNTAPFISRQLIQRLTASNPTPAYVKRVADVFVNNGAGVRGDMKAIIKAILLDPEARDPNYGVTSTTAGKIREPLLMMTQLLRTLNGRNTRGEKIAFWNLESPYDLGQNPLRSPTVFNFFRPDYAPKTLKDRGLTAPEFGIFNMVSTISRSNNWQDWIRNGLLWGAVQLDIAPYRGLATSALLDLINNLWCGGTMSTVTRNAIAGAVDATTGDERIYTALHLTMVSPDYGVQK